MSEQENQRGSAWKTVILCLLIFAVAGGITYSIFHTEPVAKREGATRKSAMLVSTIQTTIGNYRPEIEVLGTVVPARDVQLSPRVEGEVMNISTNLQPGGTVSKNELLAKIDPADFDLVLREAQIALHKAEADFELEKGRQTVARKDLEVLEQDVPNIDRELVLRAPQLQIAQAAVDAARAELDRARLDLQRTEVRAPFDGQILERYVHVGSQLAPGIKLARLVGIETYWIDVTVPLSILQRLEVPRATGESGSVARVRNRTAWPVGVTRTGKVFSLRGELEEASRLAHVLVTVDDPLARLPASEGQPPLILGEYLHVTLELSELQSVVKLSRDYIRREHTVWVMQDGLLDIRAVTIAFQNADYAFISEGLAQAEDVITSALSRVVQGIELRTSDEDVTPEAGESIE